ncbi:hypothetical protein F4824DRAFT_194681 [Ustulina deusta]|nr:hypothetical protein F4824DRAFT_194681 [Ustulina deusta]
MPDLNRDHFYRILGDLDPYKGTPKEFIHLLVNAAIRDGDVARALLRLDSDRINHPDTWQPAVPRAFAALQHPPRPPNQPTPGTLAPTPQPPNAYTRTSNPASQPPLVAPPSGLLATQLTASTGSLESSLARAPAPGQQRKRKRDETAGLPMTSQFRAMTNSRMIMYWGPQQPPPPVYVNGQHWVSNSTPQNQLHAAAPQPVPRPFLRPSPLSEPHSVHDLAATSPNIVPVEPVNSIDDANADKPIKPIDGEPKEMPCNFTWAIDRAETHLGFTGKYEKESEIRQTSIGYEIAIKLQKLLKKLCATLDKHVTIANRVHILTVMREILAATLEADHTVGKECRECSREYDGIYVDAVRKLTPEQLKRLKALEGGKWLEELQDLITEANRQAMFPLLKQAFNHINSAA